MIALGDQFLAGADENNFVFFLHGLGAGAGGIVEGHGIFIGDVGLGRRGGLADKSAGDRLAAGGVDRVGDEGAGAGAISKSVIPQRLIEPGGEAQTVNIQGGFVHLLGRHGSAGRHEGLRGEGVFVAGKVVRSGQGGGGGEDDQEEDGGSEAK